MFLTVTQFKYLLHVQILLSRYLSVSSISFIIIKTQFVDTSFGFFVCLCPADLNYKLEIWQHYHFQDDDVTAPFNNMRTLKFKAQPTNAFFSTVNQMLGSSSQPPTTAEREVVKALCTVRTTKQCSAVVVSWEKLPNIWLTAAKNAFVGRLLNFRVHMLLKSAVKFIRVFNGPVSV